MRPFLISETVSPQILISLETTTISMVHRTIPVSPIYTGMIWLMIRWRHCQIVKADILDRPSIKMIL